MPLLLDQSDWNVWLDPHARETQVKKVMRPYQDGKLDAHEISTDVTKRGVATDVPEVEQSIS
jgi:putative SOS response-associated peptidase YedK